MSANKHPHAESMLLYAQDAMETDKPWKRWQFKHKSETEWRNDADGDFGWLVDHEYRRKPCTILINGIEVPEPVKQELLEHQTYYVVDITFPNLTQQQYWINDHLDTRFLERGLIHLTEENARKHAEALLSFTKN